MLKKVGNFPERAGLHDCTVRRSSSGATTTVFGLRSHRPLVVDAIPGRFSSSLPPFAPGRFADFCSPALRATALGV